MKAAGRTFYRRPRLSRNARRAGIRVGNAARGRAVRRNVESNEPPGLPKETITMPILTRRHLLAGAGAILASSFLPRTALAQADGPHSLAPLPYPADALEPHIDARTMELHHGAHHRAYVDNLNRALADHPDLAERPLHELLADLDAVPEGIRRGVRNNGGGHANHTMFWEIMSPDGGGEPEGDLREAIDRDLGGLDQMRSDFEAAGRGVFGSGWVFVTVDEEGRLALATRPNQDTPLMDGERVLFGNDVWEHAYYLNYQNRRGEYLEAWWNVVDWARIAERYEAARAGTLTI